MDPASKRRGRPLPDALKMKLLAFELEEALAVENIYRPNLLVIQQEIQPWEVTMGARDNAVNILRLLRVWYDMPQFVFFNAVTYLDLFLSRMKVQAKYLNCLTMACFFCAAEKQRCYINVGRLVKVSKSTGSVNDILRMANIVKEKLNLGDDDNDRTTTCANFLLIFLDILEYVTTQWDYDLQSTEILEKEQLMARLAVLLTNSSSAFFRSSTLALVLIKLEVEKLLTQGIASGSKHFVGEVLHLLNVVRELQYTCKIKSAELMNCSSNASNILKQYDNQDRIRHNQHVQRRLSPATNKGNRYRHFKRLHTIEEKNQKSP